MITVSKSDAARAQINVAIRLLAENDEPVAIHTLASAAFRIVRDIAEKMEENFAHKKFMDFIKPGMEGKFWRLLNKDYNFMKHAKDDPGEVLQFNPSTNELIISATCMYYVSLGITPSFEMTVFLAWFMVRHPEMYVLDEPLEKLLFPAGRPEVLLVSREEELRLLKDLFMQSQRFKRY